MKIYLTLILGVLLSLQCSSNKEILTNHLTRTFVINHFDSFSIKESKATEKKWNFEIEIFHLKEKEYKICYSKPLTECLFSLDKLQGYENKIERTITCYTYLVDHENQVKILNKNQVINHLKNLNTRLKNTDIKKETKSFNSIDLILKNERILNEDLLREVSLIHEFEDKDIPIGMATSQDELKEEINPLELSGDEKTFLNKINWKSLNQMQMIKTSEINDEEFLYDFMFATNPLSSKEKVSFEEIKNTFFNGNFIVNEYDNITLNRDQRHLKKNNNKLNYLLKEVRTVSSLITRIKRFEIIEKKR